MLYYPIFLDIRNKPCLVIGGGKVAEKKAASLMTAGAKVTVLSPVITSGLKALVRKNQCKINWLKGRYKSGALKGFYLAVSATGAKSINKKIREEALKEKVILNVADEPLLSDFISPSVLTRGDLTIAVSTSGKSPFLAREIRNSLERAVPTEFGALVAIIGAVRNKLLKKNAKSAIKIRIYKELTSPEFLSAVACKDLRAMDRILKSGLGTSYTLKSLGVKI